MKKLSQVLAVEKNVKGRYHSEISEIYKTVQKPALFSGFSKTYEKKDEDSDELPPENQRVQNTVPSLLRALSKRATELFDTTAMKDFANCEATASVVVDGKTLVENAPPTYLLFLEKQLTDLRTLVEKLPILDDSEDWNFDENANLFKTGVAKTTRTKKVQKPIVLYPATEQHPAQTQLITEDVQAGTWNTIKMSGAMPGHEREKLLERVETLLKAVKEAREEANSSSADIKSVGKQIFDFLLGD